MPVYGRWFLFFLLSIVLLSSRDPRSQGALPVYSCPLYHFIVLTVMRCHSCFRQTIVGSFMLLSLGYHTCSDHASFARKSRDILQDHSVHSSRKIILTGLSPRRLSRFLLTSLMFLQRECLSSRRLLCIDSTRYHILLPYCKATNMIEIK